MDEHHQKLYYKTQDFKEKYEVYFDENEHLQY